MPDAYIGIFTTMCVCGQQLNLMNHIIVNQEPKSTRNESSEVSEAWNKLCSQCESEGMINNGGEKQRQGQGETRDVKDKIISMWQNSYEALFSQGNQVAVKTFSMALCLLNP